MAKKNPDPDSRTLEIVLYLALVAMTLTNVGFMFYQLWTL